MTTHEPDGYCEDCGIPVHDGINGDVDNEYSIAVCDACMDMDMKRSQAEVFAEIDAMQAQRAWQAAMVDDMPLAGF